VEYALDALTAAGCPMAVLSNKSHEPTVAICTKLLADRPFRGFWGSENGWPRKPDPSAALRLADLLDRPPAEVAFLGDSAIDIETAVRAGMRPIGVAWGFRPVQELRDAGAKTIVETASCIPEAVLDDHRGHR
jgi:phosphoglycolate phosphatase